jgi:hypothetical protein
MEENWRAWERKRDEEGDVFMVWDGGLEAGDWKAGGLRGLAGLMLHCPERPSEIRFSFWLESVVIRRDAGSRVWRGVGRKLERTRMGGSGEQNKLLMEGCKKI